MMSCLSVTQDRALEAKRTIAAISTARVELRLYHMQLRHVLPPSHLQMDAVWVIIDRLMKSAYFILICMTYPASTLAKLHRDLIIGSHIVLDSLLCFLISFHRELSTKTNFSTHYHQQTDGQFERMIQILEDLLWSCIDFEGSWKEHLPLVKLDYNNNPQASIKMTPLEALYDRPCRSPTCWLKGGKPLIVSSELLQDSLRIVE